jgi:glycosyltransferase involved in cell wall biosynthesis
MTSVLINAKSLLTPLTGIGRYTYEVISRLPEDSDFEYLYYYYGKVSKEIITGGGGGETRSLLPMLRNIITKNQFVKSMLRSMINMQSALLSKRYDIYWEPSIIPLSGIKSKKTVVTVHDISLHLHPEWHLSESVSYFNSNFWKNIKKADIVITDTAAVKDEVAGLGCVPSENIIPIHLGINDSIFRRYTDEEIKNCALKYNIDYKFIFFVGSVEPRKNLIRLIEAYLSLPEHVKDEYKLLIAGYKGWKNDRIHDLIKSDSRIKYMGFVPDAELALIYNMASVFAYPSFYEGFGLPPLEAMACGVPVLASSIPCLMEVCGNSAVYADPGDSYDIADKLLKLLSDENLRKTMSEKGLAHTEGFRWENTAAAHLRVFESLI